MISWSFQLREFSETDQKSDQQNHVFIWVTVCNDTIVYNINFKKVCCRHLLADPFKVVTPISELVKSKYSINLSEHEYTAKQRDYSLLKSSFQILITVFNTEFAIMKLKSIV